MNQQNVISRFELIKTVNVLKVQIYKEKEQGVTPNRNRSMGVVYDLTRGIKEHNLLCKHFHRSYENNCLKNNNKDCQKKHPDFLRSITNKQLYNFSNFFTNDTL